ncbi:hypothetical protein [Rhizobium bangladeshense]|uniref:hypothetical protein n=1 Tax=Rhizobium bangladeshense TaxID=1138189 RepID=UPI001C83F5C7|nr:hypothetical protein [Rhizobium bangladeshense]MBX4894921.1 hypothetical protein [Rhizobium bangladeshense]
MSQEHVQETSEAIELLLKARRKHIAQMATSLSYSDMDRIVQIQNAMDALAKVKADEEGRLPSIFETQDLQSV